MHKILNFLKTLYVNLRYLPLEQAVGLPIYCRWNVRIRAQKGDFLLPDHPERFSIRLGEPGLHQCQATKPSVLYVNGGKVRFHGSATLSQGFFIRLLERAYLTLGDGVFASDELDLACSQSITLGNGTWVGAQSTIRDSNGHPIWVDGVQRPERRSLTLGEHNWIGIKVIILKGGSLGDGNIVAAGSCLTRDFSAANHCIIGGNPARVLREKVSWER